MKLAASTAALLWALASTPARAIDVFILGPPAGKLATGEVDFVAEVISDKAILEVVFRVDGREIARRSSPPFTVRVDVGQDNIEHLFEVSARDGLGETARSSRRTPALHIDEELELELQQLYVTVTRAGERVLDVNRTAFEILQEANESIGTDLARQPSLRARLQETIGRVYMNLGLYEESDSTAERGARDPSIDPRGTAKPG